MKSEFEIISKKYNGEFKLEERIVKGIGFSSLPITSYKLVVPIDNIKISIVYEFGNYNLANIRMTLFDVAPSNFFKFKKQGALKLLFSKNKNSLDVISESTTIKNAVFTLLQQTGLEKIARDTLFEPEIIFTNSKNKCEIHTRFYLGFKNKENSLEPIIEFYKGMIKLLN